MWRLIIIVYLRTISVQSLHKYIHAVGSLLYEPDKYTINVSTEGLK